MTRCLLRSSCNPLSCTTAGSAFQRAANQRYLGSCVAASARGGDNLPHGLRSGRVLWQDHCTCAATPEGVRPECRHGARERNELPGGIIPSRPRRLITDAAHDANAPGGGGVCSGALRDQGVEWPISRRSAAPDQEYSRQYSHHPARRRGDNDYPPRAADDYVLCVSAASTTELSAATSAWSCSGSRRSRCATSGASSAWVTSRLAIVTP